MSDEPLGTGSAAVGITLFGFIFVLIALDLTQDYSEGTNALHIVMESIVLLSAATGIALLAQRFYRARRSVRILQRDLESIRRDAEKWQADSRILLEGLGVAIQRQFSRWGLSTAESAIALLLLKGLSLKEIAAIRATSERTVREQARNVYRKAGLSGRPELAAFFLEDLLLPIQDD